MIRYAGLTMAGAKADFCGTCKSLHENSTQFRYVYDTRLHLLL
jgi:hypothetical protein